MSRDQLSHSTDQKRSSPKKLTAPTLAQGGRGLFAFGEIFPLYRRLYEFLVKRLKAVYSAAGLRPLPLKNEVNTFLTAAQAVCREMAE